MRYSIAWDPAALYVFYRLPIHSATIVDRTVIRFAEAGEGTLTRVAPYYRLRAGLHDALLSIDHAARMVYVVRIYRAR